jgi:hypothetical protein
MRQIVGCSCVLCGKDIASIADGVFCRSCGCPVHADCLGTRPPGAACETCGADAKAVARERERARQEPPPAASPAATPHAAGSGLAVVFCSVLAGLGVLSLGLYAFDVLRGPTPEAALTVAEGVPADVRLTAIPTRSGETYVLHFRVGAYETQYASGDADYEAVVAAVQSGGPVRAWVEPVREGYARLYKLERGGREVLAYQAVVGQHEEKGRSVLIVGTALTLVGGLGLAWQLFKRRVDARNREMYRRAMEARRKLKEG